MLAAIRDGMTPWIRRPVIIPENWNNVEHFPLSPVGYDHKLWMLMGRHIPGLIGSPAEMTKCLREFFERERGSLPEGALLLRTLGNHDTYCESGRVDYRYGAGLAQALHGVCLMAPGIPMLYQEQEVGAFEALRVMNWARRRVPEFVSGRVDYLAVDVAPEVFSCLRRGARTHALGLSNLSGKTIQEKIHLPADLALCDEIVYDAVSGRQASVVDGCFAWRLEPYATALMRIGAKPIGAIPTVRFAGEQPSENLPVASFSAEADSLGIMVRVGKIRAQFTAGPGPWVAETSREETILSSPYGAIRMRWREGAVVIDMNLTEAAADRTPELVVNNARRWLVSGQTALLDDRLLRRHFPFPPEKNYRWDRTMRWGGWALYNNVAPTGRLWQSILEPLHPDNPALAFGDASGNGLVVSEIRTQAHNIVLTDRTDEDLADPYALALRFYAQDPDISAESDEMRLDVAASGSTSSVEPGVVSLHVKLIPCAEGDAARHLAATRLPVSRRGRP